MSRRTFEATRGASSLVFEPSEALAENMAIVEVSPAQIDRIIQSVLTALVSLGSPAPEMYRDGMIRTLTGVGRLAESHQMRTIDLLMGEPEER